MNNLTRSTSLLKSVSCGIVIVMLTACSTGGPLADLASPFSASIRRSAYEKSMDRELIDAVYTSSTDSKIEGLKPEIAKQRFEIAQFNSSSISVSKVGFAAGNMGSLQVMMTGYVSQIEGESFSVAYVEAIKLRGHVAKLYRPFLTVLLNRVLRPPFTRGTQTEEWYGLDNAIVEFDRDGRIISALVGSHQASTLIGVRDLEYRTIYMGSINARLIENKVSNYLFQDAYLRTL